MYPSSYNLCATRIVAVTPYPRRLLASCCKVDVVKGADAERVPGFVSTFRTWNSVFWDWRRKSSASFSLAKSFFSFAAISCWFSFKKTPSTLKLDLGTKALISSSRSTTKRTATDWTRPAESPGLTFFQRTGDISNPTTRSKILLACCASTKFWSICRGFSTAFKIAFLVISWKTILFVFSSFNFNSWARCHAIASPSRSSSEASQTMSVFFTAAFSSATNFFLSAETSYSGVKVAKLIPIPFLGKSRICPKLDFTSKSFPKYFWMVFAFAGDSTMTRFFDIKKIFAKVEVFF